MDYVHAIPATAVLVPSDYKDEEQNIYTSSDGLNYDDTIERTGELFSQLDHMIAAVQVESHALDSMREKLKELDTLRGQIKMLTNKALEYEQTNLTLKSNLNKLQQANADLKRSKADIEGTLNPIRVELNRTKEMYNKERMARLSAQQETAQLKEHAMRLEKVVEELERECKSIQGLTESNEILRNDLAQLKQRYKDDKAMLQNHVRSLEQQVREVDTIKANVKNYALRLLDISTAGSGTTNPNSISKMQYANAAPQQLRIQTDFPQYVDGPTSHQSFNSKHSQSISYYDNGFSNDGAGGSMPVSDDELSYQDQETLEDHMRKAEMQQQQRSHQQQFRDNNYSNVHDVNNEAYASPQGLVLPRIN